MNHENYFHSLKFFIFQIDGEKNSTSLNLKKSILLFFFLHSLDLSIGMFGIYRLSISIYTQSYFEIRVYVVSGSS